jgi:cell division protein FtsB
VLPLVFLTLAAVMLLLVLLAVWQSVRMITTSDIEADISSPSDDRAALLDEKNALLRSIKDLEFERGVGKIDDEDFARLDAKYRARAKDVLRLLDVDLGKWKAKAEALVAERLAKAGAETASESVSVTASVSEELADSVPEVVSDSVRELSSVSEISLLHCARCSSRNDADAAFCKKCGSALV